MQFSQLRHMNKQERLALFLKSVQFFFWGVGAFSLFIALFFVLTPFLLPLLTLGACMWQGRAEFMEYASTSLQMSLIPFLCASACILIGYSIRFLMQHQVVKAKKAQEELLELEKIRQRKKQNTLNAPIQNSLWN